MARPKGALLPLLLALLAGCASDDGGGPAPEPAAPSAPLEATLAFQESGTLLAGAGSTGPASPQGCDTFQEEGVDVNRHTWEIGGDINGTEAGVERVEVTMTIVDDTLLDADLFLEAPDGEVLAQAVAFNAMSGPTESVVAEGGLEPGTYTIVVRACTGSGSYDLAGEALLRTPVAEGASGGSASASGSSTSAGF